MKLSPEVKIGVFTIIAGLVLVVLSLKTAGTSLFGDGAQKTLIMNFGTVAGVEIQSKVKLSGVEVGQIDAIELKHGFASVTATVDKEVDIHSDSLATIRTAGLLGERYIEIVQGSPDSPVLKSGDTLKRTQNPADVSDMLNKAGAALEDIRLVTSSLKSVFGSLEGRKSLEDILKNIDSASSNMAAILDENRKTLKVTLNNFSKISSAFSKNAPDMFKNLDVVASELRTMIEDNRENLTASAAGLRKLTEEFSGILKENRGNLKSTLDNISSASGRLDKVMDSVSKMSSAIERVTGRIQNGEGTFGRLVNDDEVYENLNKTLVGAKKFLNKAEDIRLAVGVRGENQQDSGDTKGFVSLKIIPREDKYYLVEVAEDVRRKDLSTTRNTLNSLLYTALMAKRFSDLTVKAGLIESSAGVGVDYHLFGDSLLASAEIFNLSGYDSSTDNPQLKAFLRWSFLKYLYLYAGGDELLNDEYRTMLLGGGIMFDEDDLKMALGLL